MEEYGTGWDDTPSSLCTTSAQRAQSNSIHQSANLSPLHTVFPAVHTSHSTCHTYTYIPRIPRLDCPVLCLHHHRVQHVARGIIQIWLFVVALPTFAFSAYAALLGVYNTLPLSYRFTHTPNSPKNNNTHRITPLIIEYLMKVIYLFIYVLTYSLVYLHVYLFTFFYLPIPS
jgi:hypothetical protein